MVQLETVILAMLPQGQTIKGLEALQTVKATLSM